MSDEIFDYNQQPEAPEETPNEWAPMESSSFDDELGDLTHEMNSESAKVSDDDFAQREYPDYEPDDEQEYEPVNPEQRRRTQNTSVFVVETVDRTVSTLFALWAKSDDPSEFYANKDQVKDVAGHLAFYFQDENLDLPPWVMAVIAAAFVLFDKYKAADQVRKVNIQLQESRAREAELTAKIKMLELEKKEKELKLKVDELEKVN